MRYGITLFFIIGILTSCGVRAQNTPMPYQHNLAISDERGYPRDSLTLYFPFSDTFRNNWYSYSLWCAKEPVLNNYFLGHDRYRFLWLRSFHPPVVITLHKQGDKVWLTMKVLNAIPVLPREILKKMIVFQVPHSKSRKKKHDTTTIREYIDPSRTAKIELDKTISLSATEWNAFMHLLDECKFWTLPMQNEEYGLDGSQWIIEAHLENASHVVDRWSPEDNYRKCGEYLIELSKFKGRIY